jgi:hypothetical protein
LRPVRLQAEAQVLKGLATAARRWSSLRIDVPTAWPSRPTARSRRLGSLIAGLGQLAGMRLPRRA